MALNRSKSLFTFESETDILKIDAVNKTATKLGTYSFTTQDLLTADDGSLVSVWSEFQTTANPYGETTTGVSQIDAVNGAETELTRSAPDSAFVPVVTRIGPDGRVFSLSSKFGRPPFFSGKAQDDGLIVTAIDLTTDKATAVFTKGAYGDSLDFATGGDLIIGFTDSTYDDVNPYGPSSRVQGVSRVNVAGAKAVEQSLGSVDVTGKSTSPIVVAVSPAGDVFAAVGDYVFGGPYGTGGEPGPTTTFYRANENKLTEIGTTDFRTNNLVVESDGQRLVNWSDDLYTTGGPYGPSYAGFETGASRVDATTGEVTELYVVPGSTDTNPYGSFTQPDFFAAFPLPAPSGSDANYLGLQDNDLFQGNGVYDERSVLVQFNAGASEATVLAQSDRRSIDLLVIRDNNDLPTVAGLADQTVTAGSSASQTFTVGDTETAAGDLTVTATSSDLAVAVSVTGTGPPGR